MEDDTQESRPKRQKRESSYKAKAFEKFRQLKSGSKKKYEVEEMENIYETVDEKEYTKRVLDRQDDDWIVDDDGSGYVEDGRDIFDDDLDHESIAANTSKGKGTKRKKKAVSENAGKGNLQYLLSNMPVKKQENRKLEDDQTLSELLGELSEGPSTSAGKPKIISQNFSPLSARKAEKDYMKSLTVSVKRSAVVKRAAVKTLTQQDYSSLNNDSKKVLKEVQDKVKLFTKINANEEISKPLVENIEADSSQVVDEVQKNDLQQPEFSIQNSFNDDLDLSLIDDRGEENDWVNIEEEMMKDWIVNSEENIEDSVDLEKTDIPLTEVNDSETFRFFWWDAFEDPAKQPGVVFLFGKTYHSKTKSYVSCCVAVRNIDRKIFFLPRVTEKDSDKPITSQDVYKEINESIMKNLQVRQFKARPIKKKYAFDPTIPAESDYIEVRYSARDSQISKSTEGKTFSKVFGTESSFLEILLLDRKIKGPCWLDVSSPVPVTNPFTWCQLEINCNKANDLSIVQEIISRPPLVVSAINMRRAVNPKTSSNEIVMLSCVTNTSYSVDKQAPTVPFQKHFCVFTGPENQVLPLNLHVSLKDYKATTLQKMDSERGLLNFFVNQFAKIDCDIVVGHDLQGYQINVLSERLVHHQNNNFSKLSRMKRTLIQKQKLERQLFTGRLVCDVKISAKELIRCRSYDLDSLCQAVLKTKDGQRIDLEPEDIPRMFQTSADIFKLVSLTMQDTAFVLKIMYALSIIPLALQITNIAGNVMSKTLLGGRSERNEFLLLHAFSEKDYIVPDKSYGGKKSVTAARKKPAYSGGLVLDPKVGFYDKLILLMDFNSLYPSIIQEYNICFTTAPASLSEDNMVLPDKDLPLGILPTEIRKLVESRREVKKLMNNPDISSDLRMLYHIRQMALKLTANSMYGCLGFSNSRFYAKNLAALITYKGREILTNTRDLVQRMNFEVIYGDTDSLMINTNITDYDQVFKIGSKIKQEVNKLYKQVELDVDGVFKYLLLLKKKKYAAVTLSKGKDGELKSETEYKGLDIVRRDWSRLASEAGKFILNQILTHQSTDDKINSILVHLKKMREDLEAGNVPLSLLVITKQLTKNPNLYPDAASLPHVQVALRYNKSGGHLRGGDTVPYIICSDGTTNSATQRAYHVEELKNSESLKVDVNYYLSQQIHPVVTRICEPIEELDIFQIAETLGVDTTNLKKHKTDSTNFGENITQPEVKFRDVDKFVFKCYACKGDNTVDGVCRENVAVLEKCNNPQCDVRPVDYIPFIQNQLVQAINLYIERYYSYQMYCEDPTCTNETNRLPMHFAGRFPVCTQCDKSVMLKSYSENNLYSQLSYFKYIFDLSKVGKKPLLEYQIEKGYNDLKETVEERLQFCGYSVIDLTKMYSSFSMKERTNNEGTATEPTAFFIEDDFDDEV